jgi:hypothetical protein
MGLTVPKPVTTTRRLLPTFLIAPVIVQQDAIHIDAYVQYTNEESRNNAAERRVAALVFGIRFKPNGN